MKINNLVKCKQNLGELIFFSFGNAHFGNVKRFFLSLHRLPLCSTELDSFFYAFFFVFMRKSIITFVTLYRSNK